MKRHIIMFILIFASIFMIFPETSLAWSVNGGSYQSLGKLPGIKSFNYAEKPVRESVLDANKVGGDYSYRTYSKDIDEYIGEIDTWTRKGKTYTGCYLKDNEKGQCGVRYNKLIQYQDTWVDVKSTYVDWSVKSEEKAFVAGGFCQIQWTNINWVEVKHEFFISGTNSPVDIKGFFTFNDVDDNQGIGLYPEEVQAMWSNSGGTTIKYKNEEGKLFVKDGQNKIIPGPGESGYSAKTAAKATFSYTFSGSTHTQFIIDGNGDGTANTIAFEGAKLIPSAIPEAKAPEIEKTATKVKDNSWTYEIAGAVPLETEPGNFYDGFSIVDEIDSCLRVEGVNIKRGTGTVVTDLFDISMDNNIIEAKAKNCNDSNFYGYEYYMEIKVKLGENLIKEHGHLQEEKLLFNNQAKVVYVDGSGTYERPTNDVVTEVPLPELSIEKSSEEDSYYVGGEVKYYINVKQKKVNAKAVNVVISDSIPEGLNLVDSSLKVNADSAQVSVEENRLKIKIEELDYGDLLKIEYKCTISKSALGDKVENKAFVKADYMNEISDGAAISVSLYSVHGKKVWQDDNDRDGIRPKQVTVKLYADGIYKSQCEIGEEENWEYSFEDLDRYKNGNIIEYTVEESPVDDYTSEIEGFNIVNRHIPERIELKGRKIWDDAGNYDKIRPETVTVYLYVNDKKLSSQVVHDSNQWSYCFENLYKYEDGKKINYEIRENEVHGYEMQVEKEKAEGNQEVINLRNVHQPYIIEFTKYEKLEAGKETTSPVAGAVYEVKRESEEGSRLQSEVIGRFVTDARGKIDLENIDAGRYIFSEVGVPEGYERSENIRVELTKNSDANVSVIRKQVTAYNKRIPGKIKIIKKDDCEQPVEGVAFDLFADKECKEFVAELKTDSEGNGTFDNLLWASYYLKEISSPEGYVKNDSVKKVDVDGRYNREEEILIVNRQKKGSVTLNKTDEEGIPVEGVQFNLYKDDGSLIEEGLITDKNGVIAVENLDWGSYYFQEISAPKCYIGKVLPIGFRVNSTSEGRHQSIDVINEHKTSNLVVTKRIRKSDIHWEHGIPIFTFKLEGRTSELKPVRLERQVVFNPKIVNMSTDAGAFIARDVVFENLEPGEYICSEYETNRYELESISDLSEGCKLSEEGNSIQVSIEEPSIERAVFTNRKCQWKDYSDAQWITNEIKGNNKVESIVVEYSGPKYLEANRPFDEDWIKVSALYGNGDKKNLDSRSYAIRGTDEERLLRVPEEEGENAAIVIYEEGDVSLKETFDFNVKEIDPIHVKFETMGGEKMKPVTVHKYTSLVEFEGGYPEAYKAGFQFDGWYEDKNLKVPLSKNQALSEDMTIYAGWKKKHIGQCSWQEIHQVCENGMQEEAFGECLEHVRESSKNGPLGYDDFVHTKALEVNGNTYHCVVAGFNSDLHEDGKVKGITFITYEGTASKDSWIETLEEIEDELPAEMVSEISKAVIDGKSRTLWLPSVEELNRCKYEVFLGIKPWSGIPYWTRTPSKDGKSYYCIGSGGLAYEAIGSCQCRFMFCI